MKNRTRERKRGKGSEMEIKGKVYRRRSIDIKSKL